MLGGDLHALTPANRLEPLDHVVGAQPVAACDQRGGIRPRTQRARLVQHDREHAAERNALLGRATARRADDERWPWRRELADAAELACIDERLRHELFPEE